LSIEGFLFHAAGCCDILSLSKDNKAAKKRVSILLNHPVGAYFL